MTLAAQGYICFDATDDSRAWARAALAIGRRVAADAGAQRANLRHRGTWFVGVDALPNARDGSLGGVPLRGPWDAHLPQRGPLHTAQLSVIYPGYPKQDAAESDGNHRYRLRRGAAHVDGLHPVGPERRRMALERHAYILGISLDGSRAAPTLCWPGSHLVLGAVLRAAIGDDDPAQVDVTDAYHAARAQVFDQIAPVALWGPAGSSFLLHRFTLHGTAPWGDRGENDGGKSAQDAARFTAFFRPEWDGDARDWLNGA